jgi:hypothetical protein
MVRRRNNRKWFFSFLAGMFLGTASPLDICLVDVLISLDALHFGALLNVLYHTGADHLVVPHAIAIVHFVT